MIRSKPMLDAARDQSCMCCGVKDGTIVSCHYTGLRSHAFGKGRGIKPHDLCIADMCRACHEKFDSGTMATMSDSKYLAKIDRSEQFMYLILQTIMRRIDQGVITIKGMKE